MRVALILKVTTMDGSRRMHHRMAWRAESMRKDHRKVDYLWPAEWKPWRHRRAEHHLQVGCWDARRQRPPVRRSPSRAIPSSWLKRRSRLSERDFDPAAIFDRGCLPAD